MWLLFPNMLGEPPYYYCCAPEPPTAIYETRCGQTTVAKQLHSIARRIAPAWPVMQFAQLIWMSTMPSLILNRYMMFVASYPLSRYACCTTLLLLLNVHVCMAMMVKRHVAVRFGLCVRAGGC